MLVIPNTTTVANEQTAGFTAFPPDVGALTYYSTGFLFVANASAQISIRRGPSSGQAQWSPYALISPSLVPITTDRGGKKNPDYVYGVKFVDGVPGVHAQVFGALFQPGEAAFTPGSEFTGQVSTSGAFTPVNNVTASAWSGGPPSSPTDGDFWYALNVDTNGTVWAFRFNAGSSSTYKWELFGGNEVAAINLATGATAGGSAGYLPLTSNAVSLTMARGGDYMASHYGVFWTASAAGDVVSAAISASGNQEISSQAGNTIANLHLPFSGKTLFVSQPPGQVFTTKYSDNISNAVSVADKYLGLLPVRII